MNLDEAVQQRDEHRPDPGDWAQLCQACGAEWPCRPWRMAGTYVIGRVRDAFTGTGTSSGTAR